MSASRVLDRPVGRPCSTCTHPDRERVEAALLDGEPLSRISRTYAISSDSLRRHIQAHAAPVIRDALADESSGLAFTTMARLLEVADAARNTRLSASAEGQLSVALRAGDAEVRALGALGSRLGVEAEAASEVAAARSLHAMARALAVVIREQPQVGLAVAAQMDGDGDSAGADPIRDLANSILKMKEPLSS
jgi:hypothetical protein